MFILILLKPGHANQIRRKLQCNSPEINITALLAGPICMASPKTQKHHSASQTGMDPKKIIFLCLYDLVKIQHPLYSHSITALLYREKVRNAIHLIFCSASKCPLLAFWDVIWSAQPAPWLCWGRSCADLQ